MLIKFGIPSISLSWSACLCLAFSLGTADQLRAAADSRPESAPVIDIWYGDNQSFGQVGSPQPLINILGNATGGNGGIVSLTISVNGGPLQKLSLGCNSHRLARAGDFNAEISRRVLRDGVNVAEFVATDSLGASSRKSVTVSYTPGTRWPLPYSINWSRVKRIQDVAQIIDGRWQLDSEGVHPAFSYYDRVIALGDSSWTDYEAILTVTWNSLPVLNIKGGAPYRDHAHASICLRWQGHDNDSRQPLRKWWPLGGLGGLTTRVDSPDKLQWYFWKGDGSRHLRGDSTRVMQIGRPYTYRVRVETLRNKKSRYSMKAWDAITEAEPAAWDMVVEENEQDIRSGALLLVVHHGDVTFGNITVTPIIN